VSDDRFTELVREDHDNEREELRSKIEIDLSEESVEKGFSGSSFVLRSLA
jgi:hypothetical protein